MRTIKFPLILAIVLTAVFSFASCSDDDDVDNTKPVINLVSPAEGAILKIGSDVHFDAVFSDDVLLKSYTIEIHDNFSEHGHTSKSVSEGATKDFFFKETWSLAGKKNATVHHHEVIIPENATPGKYHLIVYCYDEAGNESLVARNIVLSHDGESGEHEHDHDHDHE